jgi:hypothetical protein
MWTGPQTGLASAQTFVCRAKNEPIRELITYRQNVYGGSGNTNGLPANLHRCQPCRWVRPFGKVLHHSPDGAV